MPQGGASGVVVRVRVLVGVSTYADTPTKYMLPDVGQEGVWAGDVPVRRPCPRSSLTRRVHARITVEVDGIYHPQAGTSARMRAYSHRARLAIVELAEGPAPSGEDRARSFSEGVRYG